MPIARRKKEKYAVAMPSAMPPLMPMPMPSAVAEKGKHSADWTKIAPLLGDENKEMGGGGRGGMREGLRCLLRWRTGKRGRGGGGRG